MTNGRVPWPKHSLDMRDDPPTPRYVFDTNMCCTSTLRAFWGTVCEAIHHRLRVTETVAKEAIRRENLETQRDWQDRLSQLHMTPKDVRRASNLAAQTASNWLKDELRKRELYSLEIQKGDAYDGRYLAIYQTLPDVIFDMSHQNGLRDKKIVVEAFAGNYDLLLSNNLKTIDTKNLTRWLAHYTSSLQIDTVLSSPMTMLEQIEEEHQFPPYWLVTVLARSSVNNPHAYADAADHMNAVCRSVQRTRAR